MIGAGGTLDTGSSRILAVTHAGTGFYYIDLDRPARECAPAAITYNLDHYASVGLSASTTPNRISVATWNLNASHVETAADLSFFLTVTC